MRSSTETLIAAMHILSQDIQSEKTIQEQCYGTCWGAQQRIDELTQQLNAANERIKRLESVENSHAAVLNAIDNWMQQHQSKEAKP